MTKPSATFDEIVRVSEQLTQQDYAIKIGEIKDALGKVDEYAIRRVLDGFETLAQMKERLQRACQILDEMDEIVPGPAALRQITGRKRLAGEYGATNYYEKFLREHRLRQPPGVADNFWIAIAGTWSVIETGRILHEGFAGDKVLADQLEFEEWLAGRQHGNTKSTLAEGYVPDLLYRGLPRGIVPPVCSHNGQILTEPETWDESEATEPVWSQTELDLGIPKTIRLSNSYENNKAIPEALFEERERLEQYKK